MRMYLEANQDEDCVFDSLGRTRKFRMARGDPINRILPGTRNRCSPRNELSGGGTAAFESRGSGKVEYREGREGSRRISAFLHLRPLGKANRIREINYLHLHKPP